MIDKTNMQGVMNVIRQAEIANSRAADASLGISNEQQQSRFASDLLAAIRSVNATQMRSAETKTAFEASGDVSVTVSCLIHSVHRWRSRPRFKFEIRS